MPFINVKTNASVPEEKMTNIKSKLGQAITAIPGKSENWLMVGIEPGYALWFKGRPDPAAMVEVSIFGSPSSSALSDLTGKITSILNAELGIPAASVYVKYDCTDDWGWNGSNF
ncbi:Macrophage migration inhibitory factor (MIF) [Ruminococcaceae bacterium FB2012]|nr:Macrophage migration inhibitory factor (MIF) [Ruminococcaceae bacterium FB2012]